MSIQPKYARASAAANAAQITQMKLTAIGEGGVS